jgi:hypothetical protein
MPAPEFNVVDYLTDDPKLFAYINELRADNARLRAALENISDTAFSPRDDDHIWMDDRTTLGLYIDITLAK